MRAQSSLVSLVLVACGSSPSSNQPNPPSSMVTADPPSVLFATSTGEIHMRQVTIFKLANNTVTKTHVIEGVWKLGWLDRDTLIGLDNNIGMNQGFGVTAVKVIDGKVVDRVRIETDFNHDPELLLTTGKEVWAKICDESHPHCTQPFVRAFPQPTLRQATRPIGVLEDRATTGFFEPAARPLPPTAAPAPGVKLDKTRVEIGDSEGTRWVTGVACEVNGTRTTYPPAVWPNGAPVAFDVEEIRWVSTQPAIYEITESKTFPVFGALGSDRRYFRACEAEPLHGYVWLGGTRWAELVEDNDALKTGTWTIWDGGTKLGELQGHAGLRANVFP